MTFLNTALFFGLFALIVPIAVHFLNRRRFEVVDWAAMQFLRIGKKTRQKIIFEQLLLLLMRMALVAVLVIAMAAPVVNLSCVTQLPGGERLARLAGSSSRDVVIVIDGSYSMDYKWNGRTAHDEAKDWAGTLIDELPPGDKIAIFQAKQQPIPVLGILTGDHDEVRSKLKSMRRPRGGVDWAKTIQEALHLLQQGANPQKEIIILTDGQRYGWADPKALESWELLAQGLPAESRVPRFWVVNVQPDRPADAPNWFISPIRANRSIATLNREVKFRFDLQTAPAGKKEGDDEKKRELSVPPKKVTFEVDGRPAGEKEPPSARVESIGMDFTQRFSTPGSHLVSAMIGEDALPGDNRRDFAVEVLSAIPVLIVDGDTRDPAPSRGSDFLRLAIAPANDLQPSFLVRTIPIGKFVSQTLTAPIAREPTSLPRVLILSNVAELSKVQHDAIEEFLRHGGGVMATLGFRSKADAYNSGGFRDGTGWLPARLTMPAGDENDFTKAAFVLPKSLENTPLDMFKEPEPESFLSARFPRYWKLETTQAGGGSALAALTTGDALFVEKLFGKGRVILSAIPLDDSWGSNFIKSHDFVRLGHELLYDLAAVRSAEVNLEPRIPIVFRPADGESPGGVTIEVPEGPRRRIDVSSWPLVYEDTRETGVYKLTTDSGKVQYFVVQPGTGESILTPCADKDRRAVQSFFPPDRFFYETDRGKMIAAIRQSQNNPELWWLFLLLVIGLLAGELLYARHLVRKSPLTDE